MLKIRRHRKYGQPFFTYLFPTKAPMRQQALASFFFLSDSVKLTVTART